MTDISQILNTLNTSPSIELLRLRNREMVIKFLVNIFSNKQGAISSENIHTYLADFLEGNEVENDDESGISAFDTYEIKPKKHIQKWTMPIRNWGIVMNQFLVIFENRIEL